MRVYLTPFVKGFLYNKEPQSTAKITAAINTVYTHGVTRHFIGPWLKKSERVFEHVSGSKSGSMWRLR